MTASEPYKSRMRQVATRLPITANTYGAKVSVRGLLEPDILHVWIFSSFHGINCRECFTTWTEDECTHVSGNHSFFFIPGGPQEYSAKAHHQTRAEGHRQACKKTERNGRSLEHV